MRSSGRFPTCVVPILLLLASVPSTGFAQGVQVEALAGEPFGVGRLQVDLPAAMLPHPLGADGLGLIEQDGRVLYPALAMQGNAGAVVSELIEGTPLVRGGPIRQQIGATYSTGRRRPSCSSCSVERNRSASPSWQPAPFPERSFREGTHSVIRNCWYRGGTRTRPRPGYSSRSPHTHPWSRTI